MNEFQRLSTDLDDGVLTITIDNPPANVLTGRLFIELGRACQAAADDDAVRVIVFDSADPDFLIAHFDLTLLLRPRPDGPVERRDDLTEFDRMCELVRTMPKPTLVKLAGRCGGGGNEFASSCDMRFGVRGRTIVNQMEVPLGLIPGGSGTQRLPRLVGRGRAMEIVLGGDDIDAQTLYDWGHLNRLFDTVEEMSSFVDSLAHRIAGFPAAAVAAAKASVLNAEPSWDDGLREETFLFDQLVGTPEARAAMQRALDLGAQTREGELRMGDLAGEI